MPTRPTPPRTATLWLDHVEACRNDLRDLTVWVAARSNSYIETDDLQQRMDSVAITVELLDQVARLRRNGDIAWK